MTSLFTMLNPKVIKRADLAVLTSVGSVAATVLTSVGSVAAKSKEEKGEN